MRIVTIAGRAALVHPDGYHDIAEASGNRFGPDPLAVLEEWAPFTDWAGEFHSRAPGTATVTRAQLGPPVPAPRQIFAIGINYPGHAAEAGLEVPAAPSPFTKFVTCLTGPYAAVALPSPAVDWEVELVAVIGRRAERVREESAWDHVAGLMVGQDLSERVVQLAGPAPQFSLAKSFPGFGPTGPALVTPDELDDPDRLALGCAIDGTTVQEACTSEMVFGVPELVARLSAVCPLLPGDLIFTGTPGGVGGARDPQRFLRPGEVLHSWIDGVGELFTSFVAGGPDGR